MLTTPTPPTTISIQDKPDTGIERSRDEERGDYQYYVDSKGRRLPRVSTILRETQPLSERIRWAKIKEKKIKKEGWTEEEWELNSERGRTRGTMTHSYGEIILKRLQQDGLSVEEALSYLEDVSKGLDKGTRIWLENETIGSYAKAFNQFMLDLYRDANRNEVEIVVEGIEDVMINETLGYGGRSDFRLKVGENHLLWDIKTAKSWTRWDGIEMSEWDLWKKPTYRTDKKTGKRVYQELPDERDRDATYLSSQTHSYFLQLTFYKLASMDMNKRWADIGQKKERVSRESESFFFSYTPIHINGMNLLALFPNKYQVLRLPASCYPSLVEEAVARVKKYHSKVQEWGTEDTKQQMELITV